MIAANTASGPSQRRLEIDFHGPHAVVFKNGCQVRFLSNPHTSWPGRGVDYDLVIVDEVDMVDEDLMRNLPQQGRRVFAGTVEGGPQVTPLQRLWNMSDREHFYLCCNVCDNLFQMTAQNMSGEEIMCTRCGSLRNKVSLMQSGRWVPSCRGEYVGFNLSQMMHPESTASDIAEKRRMYSIATWNRHVAGLVS